MPDAMKPRRHRRRTRTRKRKGPITADTIPPGRAPVGFLVADLEAVPYSAVEGKQESLSTNLSDSLPSVSSDPRAHDVGVVSVTSSIAPSSPFIEFSNKTDHTHHPPPPTHQFSIHTPTPDKPGTYPPSFTQQSPPSATLVFERLLPGLHQRPVSATTTVGPRLSLPHRASSGGPTDTIPTAVSFHCGTQRRPEMAGCFGPSLTSQARAAELNAAAAARARYTDRESDNFNNFPSSQPISLGAVSSTSQSRNKGSKSKPLSLKAIGNAVGVRGDILMMKASATPFVPSHELDTAKVKSGNRPLQNSLMTPYIGKLQQQAYERVGNSLWLHETSPRIQKNPLSHPGAFEPDCDNLMYRPYYCYIPTVAFKNEVDYCDTPVKQDSGCFKHGKKLTSTEPKQSILYLNEPYLDHPIPETAPRAYKQNIYDNAESSHVKANPKPETATYHHRYQGETNDAIGKSLASNLFSTSQDYGCTIRAAVRSLKIPVGADSKPPMMVTDPVSVGPSNQTWYSVQLNAKSHSAAPESDPERADLAETDDQDAMSKLDLPDTKREMANYVNDPVGASKSMRDKKITWLSTLMLSATEKEVTAKTTSNNMRSLCGTDSHLSSQEKENTSVTSNGVPSETQKAPMSKAPTYSASDRLDEETEFQQLLALVETGRSAEGGKINENDINQLSHATEGERLEGSRKLALSKERSNPLEHKRLADSIHWFHTDGRGEKEFRQQILTIAQEATKRKSINGTALPWKGNQPIGPYTLLLGDILANLRSYIVEDPKKKSGYFASFGDAPRHCFEPNHGGRRSYFDREPSGDWRFPVGRAFADCSYRANDFNSFTDPFLQPQPFSG